MEIFTMTTTTLSMPLTPACAPSVSPLAPAAAPRPFPASVERAPISPASASVVVLAAERAPVSQVHQALVQAELGVMALLAGEINGTNGFNGTTGSVSTTGFKDITVAIDEKRYVDGSGGVPPRGRPV